jgi:hypothetical protein
VLVCKCVQLFDSEAASYVSDSFDGPFNSMRRWLSVLHEHLCAGLWRALRAGSQSESLSPLRNGLLPVLD